MAKCKTVSDSSGGINEENQQQVETFRSDKDTQVFLDILCELKKHTELLEALVTHNEIITDEEGL